MTASPRDVGVEETYPMATGFAQQGVEDWGKAGVDVKREGREKGKKPKKKKKKKNPRNLAFHSAAK